MRVVSIRLKNFRSFEDSGVVKLSKKITVLIGANNSGKTSVLRGLQLIQDAAYNKFSDVRVNTSESNVDIVFEGISRDASSFFRKQMAISTNELNGSWNFSIRVRSEDRKNGDVEYKILSGNSVLKTGNNLRFQAIEPNHFIIPHLSKRKVFGYNEDIKEPQVLSITSDFSNLGAKLFRLGNSSYPFHKRYIEACHSILGFELTVIPSQHGHVPGIYMPDGYSTLSVDQLGEGVVNIAYFLASLLIYKDKLFIIEEPENDLHPEALKKLLELIVLSSNDNQFVISTHSNIVVKYLCDVSENYLCRITLEDNGPSKASQIKQVLDTDERIEVLSELGYSISDFNLWDAWIILEESSAERIIRDYLIPWFAPGLSKKVRTISSGGASKVGRVFEDLNRLFCFTHLTPIYQQKSWVLVDGDDAGKEIIEKLKSSYSSDRHGKFRSFLKNNFEEYYPHEFSKEVRKVLETPKSERPKAKKYLLDEVV